MKSIIADMSLDRLAEIMEEMPKPKTDVEMMDAMAYLLMEKVDGNDHPINQLMSLYFSVAVMVRKAGCADIPLCFESAAAQILEKSEEIKLGD